MRLLPHAVIALLLSMPAWTQETPARPEAPDVSTDGGSGETESSEPVPKIDPEEQDLRRGVRDANGSQVDIVRALERHLRQFPESRRREEIEYVLLKAAIDLDDEARIAKYGPLFLDTGANDVTVLDRVIPVLLRDPSEGTARRVLGYAKRYEEEAQSIHDNRPTATGLLYSWKRRRDRAFARAFVFQARAQGNLGDVAEAVKLARRSYEIEPSAEAARELGRWHAKLDRLDEALASYAEAFSIEDARNDAAHRDEDLERLREIYGRRHGSEQGLGDLILAARVRTQAAVRAKAAELAGIAPNATATKPAEFVLSALEGDPLRLESLRGKVVVVDFWATWCGPCRRQHPLYEEVKKRFASGEPVVFLSVNTDEDRAVVPPFLEENEWPREVYFEDGLAGHLKISSIPTTLVLGKDGSIFSRMNGFIPETFVVQLSERVSEALSEKPETLARAGRAGDSAP